MQSSVMAMYICCLQVQTCLQMHIRGHGQAMRISFECVCSSEVDAIAQKLQLPQITIMDLKLYAYEGVSIPKLHV